MPQREGATAQFGRLSQELQQAAFHFGSMITAASGVGKSLNAFRELEKQLTLTNAVASGTVEDLKNMEKAVRDFALASTAGAAEAANALYFLSSAGFSVAQSGAAMTGVLLLAQATLEPIGESADIVASNIRAFGLEAQDAGRISNVFVAAISKSQATLPKLGFAFRQVGPVAAAARISIEKTTAALGVLFNIGLRGEQAGTALRNIIVRLEAPVGAAKVILDKLGISTLDATGKMRDLSEILSELRSKNLAESQLSTIFGTEALAAGLVLMESTSGAWKKLEEQITNTQEAFRVSNDQLNTFDGSLELAENSITEFGIEAGQTLAPVLRVLADALTNMTIAWRELDEPTKKYLGTLAGMALTAGLVTKATWLLGKALFALPANVALATAAIDGLILRMVGSNGIVGAMGAFLFNLNPVARALAVVGAGIAAVAAAGGLLSLAINPAKRWAKEVAGIFGDRTLEPIQTFAPRLEKELKRIDLTFGRGIEGSFDRNRVLQSFQQRIKGAIEEQQQNLDSIVSALSELDGQADALERVGDTLGSALDFGRLLGFGKASLLTKIEAATAATKADTAEEISDAIATYFLGTDFLTVLDIPAHVQYKLIKSKDALAEVFKEGGDARKQIDTLIASEKSAGSSNETIIGKVLAFIAEEGINIKALTDELGQQGTKAGVDLVILERVAAKAKADRELATEDFIALLKTTTDINGDIRLRKIVPELKAGLAEEQGLLKVIRDTLNNDDNSLSMPDVVTIIAENLSEGSDVVAAKLKKASVESDKNFVLFDDYVKNLALDAKAISASVKEAEAELSHNFEEVRDLRVAAIIEKRDKSLIEQIEKIKDGVATNEIFKTLGSVDAFKDDPELIKFITGEFLIDASNAAFPKIVNSADTRAVVAQKIEFIKSLTSNEGLKELLDRGAEALISLVEESNNKIAVGVKTADRQMIADILKDARLGEDTYTKIRDQNLSAVSALAQLVPDDFEGKLRADVTRLTSVHAKALRDSERAIEDNLRDSPVTFTDELAAKLRAANKAAADAEFAAGKAQLTLSSKEAEISYKQSLEDYYNNIEKITIDVNERIAAISAVDIDIRLASLKENDLTKIRNDADAAIRDAENAFRALDNVTKDTERKSELLAGHNAEIDAINRKREADEAYALSAQGTYERLTKANQERIAQITKEGKANDSFVAGAQAKILELQDAARDGTFRMGQEIMASSIETLSDGFTALFTGIEFSWRETLRQMAIDVVRSQIKKALISALGSLVSFGLGGGFSGGVEGIFGGQGSINRTIKGGSPEFIGPLQEFAKGGVVDSFSTFPMAGGRMGSLAEGNRPEAIMPLRRDASGNLGVMASGGGGSVTYISNTYVTVEGGSSSGDRGADDAFAKEMGEQMRNVIDARMSAFIQKNQRIGGMLNKGVR